MPKEKEIEITMHKFKNCIGSVRYKADATNAILTDVYLKKHSLPNKPPDKVKVVVKLK